MNTELEKIKNELKVEEETLGYLAWEYKMIKADLKHQLTIVNDLKKGLARLSEF